MIVKNLLLSTVLTVVSFNLVASAADSTVQPNKQVQTTKQVQTAKSKDKSPAPKKVSKNKDDAYSPAQHHTPPAQHKEETMMIFAEVSEQKQHEPKQYMSHNDSGFDVTLGGKVDIQYGFIDQRSFFRNPSSGENLRQSDNLTQETMNTQGSAFTNQDAMVSNGELRVKAEKTFDACQKYGLEINVNTNTSPASSGNANIASKVFIYTEGNFGRVELGANDGPNNTMAFSAPKIAKGTGGIDGDYSNWLPYTVVGSSNEILDDTFILTAALPYSAYNQPKANKITYYTPTYNGFKGGLSYIRDAKVQGTVYEALSFKGDGYKNVFEGGISYENKFNEMSLGLSLNGQLGDARDAYINETLIPLNKLGAWEVGGKISYDAFTLAASYGDYDTSGTMKDIPANTPSQKANFWTAGLAYDYNNKGGMSVTYLNSQKRGGFAANAYNYINANQETFYASTNKYEALSLGGEYQVMPGLMPYAEFTSFNYKTSLTGVNLNKGSVILTGVKLNF